jgi:hypothetical protein
VDGCVSLGEGGWSSDGKATAPQVAHALAAEMVPQGAGAPAGTLDAVEAVAVESDPTRIDVVLSDGTRISLRVEAVW